MTVVGTRPEIIRLSRVIASLDQYCDHVLVHTDREHVQNLASVTALQEALLVALRHQIDSNHVNNSGQLFARLLMTMTQLRELSTEHKKLLNVIKGLPAKSHDEIFGLIE